jgi:hypothetical protein
MPFTQNYSQAVVDFHEARRKAQLQEIVARLTGESNELLSYEEVRQKLKAIEGSAQTLRDIPLDAIIGSVGRYTDFTRDFLPRYDADVTRWASVMEKTIDLEGLPAISVYQIGDVYFVLDGNHRVSVAQQLGASHIQAYVTEVKSRVPLTPDIQPDQLIIKAEQANFLEHTRIDQIRPDVDLAVTIPGQYPILEEHISVHRYFMGIDQGQEIPYEAAVAHWYDEIYLPVVDIICERGILKNFSNRTVTDLYLWISRHRADLERFLGWQVGTEAVVEDLVSSHAQDFNIIVARIADRILDVVTPDPLESGPPVGYWREEHRGTSEQEDLFKDILVALDKDFAHWFAFDQAVIIAKRDRSKLLGLHILTKSGSNSETDLNTLGAEYSRRCKGADVTGELAFEVGGVARVICERAQWADLIISRLVHPPGDNILNRFEGSTKRNYQFGPRFTGLQRQPESP